MIKYLILIITFSSIIVANDAKTNVETNKSKISIFLADVVMGSHTNDIKPFKIPTALNFAATVSGKYTLISADSVKSATALLKKSDSAITIINLARQLKADKIYYVTIARLRNIIRVDISSILSKDTTKKTYGVGYSVLQYRKKKNEKPLYDPAILNALMRAMAVCENDSALFYLSDSVKVLPVPTLIIGGLTYKENPELPKWGLFESKVVSSYDAVETIYDDLKYNNRFVTYDTESRDSLYALFNLFGVENYNPPSNTELQALQIMEVDLYITGIFERIKEGAIIELYLCRIDGAKLRVLKKNTVVLKEDNNKTFRKSLIECLDLLVN